MAPKFVTRHRMINKRGNNDTADAAAICDAVQRTTMRFVPPKSIEQRTATLKCAGPRRTTSYAADLR